MIKEGFIEEKEILKQGIRRHRGDSQAIVRITEKGRIAYLNHEDDVRYHKASFPQRRYFDYKQIRKVVWPYLTQQKVKILFNRAQTLVFPLEKPSLEYLWYSLIEDSYKNRLNKVVKSDYLDPTLDNLKEQNKIEKLNNILESGIFYTKNEFRTFSKYVSESSQDTFKGIKWEGLFISKYTCFIVFVSPYGKNRRVAVPSSQLDNLFNRITATFCNPNSPLTEVRREIPSLANSDNPNIVYRHDVSALLISIGDSLAVSSAMGYAHGLVTSNKRKGGEYELVDKSSQRFKMIFVIQDNRYGIEKLFYLTSRTLEEWHKEMGNIFASDKRFSLSAYNKLLTGVFDKYQAPSIYLPVFEVKLCYELYASSRYSALTFVTDHRMIDSLSHIMRDKKELHFVSTKPVTFESDDYEYIEDRASGEVDDTKYFIYDEFGYIKGVRILEKYFLERGFKFKHNSNYLSLPSYFGVASEEIYSFYNDIAKGKIDLSLIFEAYKEQLELKEASKVKERKNHKITSVVLDMESQKKFNQILKEGNYKSKVELAKKILTEYLNKEE